MIIKQILTTAVKRAAIGAAGVLMLSASAWAQRGFAIVVDPASYREARAEIEQYASAIEDMQGLKVFTVIDRWGVPDSIRAELIRLHASKKNPIEGAVFIGDIPVAMVRDGQHLTSAFKMNQKNNRKESSVPSDRYYDDFGLKFKYIGKDDDAPYYYYSLTADSEQFLAPDLYTGRIRPTDAGGVSRYDKLRAYLKKVVAEKRNPRQLKQMLYFGGHGYISESMVARIDEKQGLYEHFPWLKRQQNGISFIDHSQDPQIKFRLMNELMRPDLDYAILHHHGYWDTQYLNSIPKTDDPMQAKALIQSYGRAHIRHAKEKGRNPDSMMIKLEKAFDIPRSWLSNTFDAKIERKDSIDDYNLDLHVEDFKAHDYKPNCRVVMIDACFCGSFHKEDCIADEYIFSAGKTVACIANTVNVLQDKWSDRYMGLLGLGMPVGDLARYSGYLESHVIGDPTYTFLPAVKTVDVDALLASGSTSQWRKLLKDSRLPDLQCMAIEQLNRRGAMSSEQLLDIFRTTSSAIVRIQALVSLSRHRDDNFIEAIRLAVNDSYEMVQRFGLRFLGQSGDARLIPSLISVCISNNTSERCNFNAMTALSLYPEEEIVKEFHRQFDGDQVCYLDKADVGGKIERALRSSSHKWLRDIDKIVADSTPAKARYMSIRVIRNSLPYYAVPRLLDYLKNCPDAETQVALLEALGWHRYSYMAGAISDCARRMADDGSRPQAVRDEALKTFNRLKTID